MRCFRIDFIPLTLIYLKNMNLHLTGKYAVVCGASQGIGAAIAEALAREGVQLLLVARSADKLENLRQQLTGTHEVYACDFSQAEEVARLAQFLGNEPIDILVNNTGGPPAGPVLDASLDDFGKALQMHLFTAHQLVQSVVAGMKKRQYGRIINVISTSTKIPIAGLGVSNTTRGAMASWAKTLSGEVASFGITVNNILPGAVETDRLEAIITGKAQKSNMSAADMADQMRSEIPAGRFGQPEELGALAAFLASVKASYITGVSIPVDGGRTGAL